MVTYANTLCQHCNAIHAPAIHIDENLETKRRTKEIVHHLSLIYNRQGGGRTVPAGAPQITNAEAERPYIIGVLKAGPLTFVAHSGGASATFTEALRRVTMTMPGLILAGPVVVPVQTRGGTPIAPAVIAGCQAPLPGGNVPLSCAAPKLIDAANRNPAAIMPYFMSEVWVDVRNFERATAVTGARTELVIAGVHTDHGHSRQSCATCQNVVPILMCPI